MTAQERRKECDLDNLFLRAEFDASYFRTMRNILGPRPPKSDRIARNDYRNRSNLLRDLIGLALLQGKKHGSAKVNDSWTRLLREHGYGLGEDE
jgi:hypothetical protein